MFTTPDCAFAENIAVAPHGHARGFGGHTLIVEPIGDGLRLADNAESWRCHNGDAAVALIAAARDERMNRSVKSDGGGIRRDVMHAPICNEKRARNAICRHIRQCRSDGRKYFCAIGLAIGLSCLDDTDLKALDVLELGNQRVAGLIRLARAIAEILARASVDHDGGDRCQRFALFFCKRGIGQCQQDKRQRADADCRTARARNQ